MLPEWRIARLAYFVMLLQWMALINGFGKVNHDLHGWLFRVESGFVFLPDHGLASHPQRRRRHYFPTVFWAAQLFVLFFYTLTGLWKVVYAVEGLFGPEMSAFELDGFSYILADRISNTSQDTVVGSFVVRHSWLGWMLFNGTMYLEGASLLIAFRPRLHRIWGLGLILFHAGTQLAMGFTFLPTISLVVLCSCSRRRHQRSCRHAGRCSTYRELIFSGSFVRDRGGSHGPAFPRSRAATASTGAGRRSLKRRRRRHPTEW